MFPFRYVSLIYPILQFMNLLYFMNYTLWTFYILELSWELPIQRLLSMTWWERTSEATTAWWKMELQCPMSGMAACGLSRDKNKFPFHYKGLECKSKKSRCTWSNRKIWPWSTKLSRERLTVLPREHTGHSQHRLPTTQEMTLHMDITRLSIPKSDWLYSLQPKMEKFYTVSKNKSGSWLGLRSWTPYCQIQT